MREVVGYEEGKTDNGMKLDFVDICKSFFHADAGRERFMTRKSVSYRRKVWNGKLQKSLHGTRDAVQDRMDAYIKVMEDMGFTRAAASCELWCVETTSRHWAATSS